MTISGKTRICALIGDPVEHSMSPPMHNAAFQELGLDYIYIPFRVSPDYLEDAVAGLKALNIVGFNVTIPHKVAIIPFLDKLDPLAEKIGAVNTVVNKNGVLTGFNTDAEGFYRALLDSKFVIKGKKAVVLGAGGAARAVSIILAGRGADLTIVNRQQELDWAENIAKLIHEELHQEVKIFELNDLAKSLTDVDLVVNATSVGMYPSSNVSLVPAALLKKVPFVFDVVYNPIKTKLLQDAASVGAKTISGIDMLGWQGAIAFEKWTGKSAPLDTMRSAALKMLEQHED